MEPNMHTRVGLAYNFCIIGWIRDIIVVSCYYSHPFFKFSYRYTSINFPCVIAFTMHIYFVCTGAAFTTCKRDMKTRTEIFPLAAKTFRICPVCDGLYSFLLCPDWYLRFVCYYFLFPWKLNPLNLKKVGQRIVPHLGKCI